MVVRLPANYCHMVYSAQLALLCLIKRQKGAEERRSKERDEANEKKEGQ